MDDFAEDGLTLNSYAARVRDAALSKLPDLARHMTTSTSGALVIRVPHPAIPSGLRLSTEGDEITLGFERWHTHGELLGGASPDEQIDAALLLMARILGDEIPIAVSYVGGEFDDAWVTDDPAREARYAAPNERLRVGTWSGLIP